MNDKAEHFVLLLGGKEPRLIRRDQFLPVIHIPAQPEFNFPSTTGLDLGIFITVEYETYKFVGTLDNILLYRLDHKS